MIGLFFLGKKKNFLNFLLTTEDNMLTTKEGVKKIVVASKNPVKIKSALLGFQRMFPNENYEAVGVSVASGVADQPMSEEETLKGAENRVNNSYESHPDADYYVGIEGGIEEKEEEMGAFAWIVVRSKDGVYGKGRTATFFLPPRIASLVREGKELGEADDIVFKRENSKQSNGSVGLLTGDVIDRTAYYTDAVILSLIPFKNKNLFQ
jgi:inosine/xanthosine triphosphatase